LKNQSLLLVLLVIAFVGITSCGQDNSQNQELQQENMALQQQLMMQRSSGTSGSVVTMTQMATAYANVTVTNGTSSVATNSGTTVVYTITSNSVGTAIRQ
jgi:hypothetical protein